MIRCTPAVRRKFVNSTSRGAMTAQRHSEWRQITALICTLSIAPGTLPLLSQQAPAGQASPAGEKPKPKTPEQLESLVAPIALYPDPLLAQVLAASTYPLEIVQARRWLTANPKLK